MIDNGSRVKGKNKNRHITAFYMETLVLAAVFTIVILVLARIFALSRQMGTDARILTNAVHLAENAAEAVAASDSAEALQRLLDENGNAERLEGSGTGEEAVIRARYDEDMNPLPDGSLWMDVTWEPEEAAPSGRGLVRSVITVNRSGEAEPVYTLETAVYIRKTE